MDHAEHSTSVIAIGNQKGGVAKTTNTAHIAAALGKLGRKVLVVALNETMAQRGSLGFRSCTDR